MQMKRLLSFVGLSVLVVASGCAKKKDLPPRGNLIGSAQFSPQLQFDLQSALEVDGKILDMKGHCMQMVERNDGQKVVELSEGKCPANGLVDALNIIASMKVYSETEPGDSTYLVMGTSPVLDQNTDVAILKNITEADSKSPQYQIESLCQQTEREDLSKNCSIQWSDSGAIQSIKYKKSRPANLVRRHDIFELRADMVAMDVRISDRITLLDSTINQKIDAMDTRLKNEDIRIEGKLDKAVTDLQAADGELKKADAKLELSIAAVRTDLTDSINSEITTRINEDAKLLTGITTVSDALKAEKDVNVKDSLAQKLSVVSTNLTKLGDDLRESDKQIRSRVREIRKQLNRFKRSEAALSESTRKSLEGINTELKKLEAMETKHTTMHAAIEALQSQVKPLLPPEKPEAPPLPEEDKKEESKQEDNNTESPKP